MTSVIWLYIDDNAAPGCELDGIPYQIVQDLGKSPRVGRDGRRARIDVLFNDHAGLHQLGRSVKHLTHKLVKICLHHGHCKAGTLSASDRPARLADAPELALEPCRVLKTWPVSPCAWHT